MYKTKKNDQGQLELWYHGENSISLLGIYETEEELEQAQKRVQKQEERAQFKATPSRMENGVRWSCGMLGSKRSSLLSSKP